MGNFFIRRPIVAMVISIVTVIVGAVSLSRLPISQYPEITPPLIQVTTTYVGASAQDVEQTVATPIEQQVNGVERSIYLKSTNANDGTLKLEVSFEVGSDLDINNVLTQNRVSGDAVVALRRQELRRERQEVPLLPLASGDPHLALRRVRLQLPLQLRADQHQRPARAHPGRGPGQLVRRVRLRDAHLGAARPPPGAGAHGH